MNPTAYDFSLEKGFGFALIGSDTANPDELADVSLRQTYYKQSNEDLVYVRRC